MFRLVAIAALTVVATPSLATERAHTPQQVSDALKAGCSVHHVHSPSGKTVQQPAIVHCKRDGSVEIARSEPVRHAQPTVGQN